MRKEVSFTAGSDARVRLKAVVADPKRAQKHVWRARIVLLSADGLGTQAIMRATGKSKNCVWRWQERFMEEGVAGLLRDKTRPPGKPPRTLADKMGPLDTVFRDLYGRGQFMPPAGMTVEDMPALHKKRVRAAQQRGALKKSD